MRATIRPTAIILTKAHMGIVKSIVAFSSYMAQRLVGWLAEGFQRDVRTVSYGPNEISIRPCSEFSRSL